MCECSQNQIMIKLENPFLPMSTLFSLWRPLEKQRIIILCSLTFIAKFHNYYPIFPVCRLWSLILLNVPRLSAPDPIIIGHSFLRAKVWSCILTGQSSHILVTSVARCVIFDHRSCGIWIQVNAYKIFSCVWNFTLFLEIIWKKCILVYPHVFFRKYLKEN